MKSNFKLIGKLLLLLTSMALFFAINTKAGDSHDMNVLTQQPVFKLKIHTFGVRYYIRVNGIEVLREFSSDGQLTTEIPINHWMHPKDNRFGLDILPNKRGEEVNPNAFFELTLMVSENNNRGTEYLVPIIIFRAKGMKDDSETEESVGAGNYELRNPLKLQESGSIVISRIDKNLREYEGSYSYDRTMQIENSLPLWAFFESDELDNYDVMADEIYYKEVVTFLRQAYAPVQNALKTKNIESILSIFDERNRETDAAFYLEPGTTAQRINAALVESINDSTLTLNYLDENTVNILLEPNRKMASLTRAQAQAAIGFDISSGGSERYPMMFRRQNGKWILTR